MQIQFTVNTGDVLTDADKAFLRVLLGEDNVPATVTNISVVPDKPAPAKPAPAKPAPAKPAPAKPAPAKPAPAPEPEPEPVPEKEDGPSVQDAIVAATKFIEQDRVPEVRAILTELGVKKVGDLSGSNIQAFLDKLGSADSVV